MFEAVREGAALSQHLQACLHLYDSEGAAIARQQVQGLETDIRTRMYHVGERRDIHCDCRQQVETSLASNVKSEIVKNV